MDSTEQRRLDDEEELLRHFSLTPAGQSLGSAEEPEKLPTATTSSHKAFETANVPEGGGGGGGGQRLPCPKAPNPDHQTILEAVWPMVMDGVEKKMVLMEQALIKRHNVKMMNEMQEVVRQIMTAKTRNEEILLAYNTRLGEITRALTDLAEKQSSSKEVDDVKRQINQLRQLLNIRCGQTTEQVAQLKQSVIITLQRERTEMQQRISQLLRNDLTMVIHQCDRRMKEGHAQTLALKKVLRQLCSIIDGGEALVTELPDDEGPSPALEASKILNGNPRLTSGGGGGGGGNASGLTAAGFPRQQPQQQTQQQTISPSVQGFNRPQASATTPATPTSNNNTTPIATNAASGSAAQQAALTKRIAELIKRQSGNVSSQSAIAQLLAHLPQQQQQQLQQLLQQQQQKSYGAGTTTQQQSVMRAMNATAAAAQQRQQQQQQQQQRSFGQAVLSQTSAASPSVGLCPFISTFGWCKFGDNCQFIHVTNNREPLRHLPPAMIAQLQQQHSAQVLSGQITSSAELMQAIANTGVAKQAQQSQPGATSSTSQSTFQADTTASVSSSSSSSSSATQQDLIAAQIAHQQEGVSMGPKAKTIPCKFNSAGKCAYGSRCAYNHGGELPVGAATVTGGRPANQPTAAAVLAAMAKETRVQQNASLLSIPQQQQQQQAGRQSAGPVSTSVNRSSSEGRRPVGLSSKEGRSLVGSDVVTAAWLKDHLPELDFARNGQPPAPSGGDTEVVTATAAAAPPTSPPPPEAPKEEDGEVEQQEEEQHESEPNGESSNTVDFGEVVVEEPVNTKNEDGGIESAGPPPGKLQAYLRLKMVLHESGLGFAPKTESG
ncbi:hypothetical protein FOZ61_004911 [Perkinsus olseni]|uniref:C3H1-type domain-containing protein n=1 Tax=Perkinsus olseni TaxID=32597 RepID=A0A7J6LJM0_PEROL|nr:hypothetical protein FOZ61_004911 [Perkinsus olseni]